jgi:glutamate:GABA antiporter
VTEEGPSLRRELGLRDITLFAIACIVGTRWIAAAAHAGPGSVTLWLLAAVFFVVPLAVTVSRLVVKYPGSGGLYLWTRGDFGPWHGFLAFWVYWMGIAVWFPSAAMFYGGAALHAAGIAESRAHVLAISLALIWIALGTNIVGLKIGKWTENIGGASAWLVTALFVALAAAAYLHRGTATRLDITPKWDWDTVSFWATIAYAMSGLELAGMMGGEVRDPQRTFPRAGWIASGCITVFYASATVALLVLLPPSRVGPLNGLADAGDEAARIFGAGWLGPAIALLVVASGMGQLGGTGTAISRLPFAAGADRLLPEAFSRVHPRWGTPYVSIFALGLVATFLLAAIQFGDTMYAAYQALISLMVITGFLPYLYIFGSAWKCGSVLSALSGWAVTVLAIACSVIPTDEIHNVWLFEAKLAAGTIAVIGSALLVYRRRSMPRNIIKKPS